LVKNFENKQPTNKRLEITAYRPGAAIIGGGGHAATDIVLAVDISTKASFLFVFVEM